MNLYTGKALGNALGLTPQEVESLQRSGVISYNKGTLYALKPSAASIIAHYREGNEEREIVDYATERALLMRAKRQKQEYETRLKEGSVHDAADVEMLVGTMLLNFRARLMGIPSKLAPQLAGESTSRGAYDILKEAIDDALNELADYDKLFGAVTPD